MKSITRINDYKSITMRRMIMMQTVANHYKDKAERDQLGRALTELGNAFNPSKEEVDAIVAKHGIELAE